MRDSLKISIPETCDQHWDEMVQSAGGKYCSSCEKEVKDFTTFSTWEVQAWFQLHQNQKTCGRFYKNQLSAHPTSRLVNGIKGYVTARAFVLSLLTFPLMTKVSAGNSNKLEPKESSPVKKSPIFSPPLPSQNLPTDTALKIKGSVLDMLEPVPGAIIQVKGTDLQVVADQSGHFEIDLSAQPNLTKPILVVSFIMYQTTEYIVDLKSNKPITIMIRETVVGGICIRQNIFKRIGNLLRKKR